MPVNPKARPRLALLRALLLATVCLTMAALATAVTPAEAAARPYRGGTVVALGDSRAAGMFRSSGDADFHLGCGRSAASVPAKTARMLGATRVVNLACGGATSSQIWRDVQFSGPHGAVPQPVQLDRLPADAQLILVSTGHNDLQWAGIRARCMSQHEDRKCRADRAHVRTTNGRLARMRSEVSAALRAIRAKAPNAQIIVIGPGGIVGDRGCPRQLPMSDADARWLSGVFDRADAIQARVAAGIGATYVGVQQYANAHGACSGGQAWFAGEHAAPGNLKYHMNQAGSQAIARLVSEAVVR